MKDLTGSPLLIRYQKAYEENPKSRVFAPLAEAYRKLGMLEKAQEILLKGIKIHPTYALGYLGLAHCYADLEQFEEVYKTLKTFATTDRDNLKLQTLFAEACMRTGKEHDALETFKYLLFINPKDTHIASLVKTLEDSAEQEMVKQVAEKPTSMFEIDKITSNPDEYDYDDWRQEDFLFSSKDHEIDDTTWAMTESTPQTLEEESVAEEEREFSVDPALLTNEIDDLTEEELASDDITEPVITHTLVDLYCAQGHLGKAKEILEKILILNPTDEKTKEKLIEIMSLTSTRKRDGDETLDDVEDLESADIIRKVEVSPKAEVEVEKQDLMNYFDTKMKSVENEITDNMQRKRINKLRFFLDKISLKAKNRAQSSSTATL